MDGSFSKSCESTSEINVHIDNDSGYISHNQESNSDSVMENLNENLPVATLSDKPVYLSEDALLETPEIYSDVQVINSSVISEQNNTPEASCSSMKKKFFSALQDSSRSEVSAVIGVISPIMINLDNSYCDINSDVNVETNTTFASEAISETSSFVNHTSKESSGASYLNLSEDSNYVHSQSQSCAVSKENCVNVSELNTPEKLHKASVNSSLSPDIFSDEESIEHKLHDAVKINENVVSERFGLKQDHKLIRRIQNALCGVLPPPNITLVNLTVQQMLEKIENNKYLFWDVEKEHVNKEQNYELGENDRKDESLDLSGSLLITSTLENCIQKKWPNVLEERYHGLLYNRSKFSEEFEQLCMKYATRYVGAETQSSCTVFDTIVLSPSKRKLNSRLRWGIKSPGRRLSHLARRRITFSSANIQASSSGSLNAASRQIVMDSRRFDLLSRRRSPKKKTPRKSPRKSPRKKICTPSSSTKKRLSSQLQMISEDSEHRGANITSKLSSTKRALFQSPEHNRPSSSLSKPLFPCASGSSPFKKRPTPKCALFTSPAKASPSKLNNKRKRIDSEESHPAKLPRSLSLPEDNIRYTAASRIRSNSVLSANSTSSVELSAHHKKKLQWAVYESLRTHNINVTHPQFKQFASVLAKVTRKFLPNLSINAPRPEGGTSERMLRIARQHVFAVIRGKSVEEIVQCIQKSKLKQRKPSGYIALEEAIKSDISSARNKENVFKDKLNTMSIENESYLGLNRQELIKTTLTKAENRVDRVRKIINFDNNSPIGNSVR